MAELPAKRRLEDPAKKSVAQISKTRQLEKMKDLESRVASLSRARDVLLVKNRMTKQLLAVKASAIKLSRRFIDATPDRWLGRGGLSPLDSVSTVASSPRMDLVKNQRVRPTVPTHWLIDAQVKARTLQQGNQVTAYLRLENAKLATALEDLKKLEGPPDAAELYRATSLLGPSFAVHDHLGDVNALFADASDRFHGDRCEDI